MYEPVTLTESIGPKLENHNDHSTENTKKEKKLPFGGYNNMERSFKILLY